MCVITLTRIALAILFILAISSTAKAHCFVGDRFFPATLIVDDPCVNDELSLPTIAGFKNGDQLSADELDISGEYSKTITERFGVSVGDTWVHLHEPGDGNHAGFDNLETSFKYQFIKSDAQEFAFSAALDVDWGRNRKLIHWSRTLHHAHPHCVRRQRLRFSVGGHEVLQAVRDHGTTWLRNPDRILNERI